MKELHELHKSTALNRIRNGSKIKPCPIDKKELITEAFKYIECIKLERL